MKVRIWGCRGSLPSPGPSTIRYGGNTSCVEVELESGRSIILDAGTGIRALGAAQHLGNATVLLSHYHWDHIQGMPFFSPVYDPSNALTVYGPLSDGAGPQHYLSMQMLPPYFPAAPSQMTGIAEWHTTGEEPFAVDGAVVRAARLSHPGMTYGYRIEADGQTVVYMSDDEPALATPDVMRGMVDLAADADLLLHDCQYSDAEYPRHHGWGHATPSQLASLALRARVRRIMLFHHDPSHSDDQIDAMAEEVRSLAPDVQVLVAAEGMEICLPSMIGVGEG